MFTIFHSIWQFKGFFFLLFSFQSHQQKLHFDPQQIQQDEQVNADNLVIRKKQKKESDPSSEEAALLFRLKAKIQKTSSNGSDEDERFAILHSFIIVRMEKLNNYGIFAGSIPYIV